MACSFVSTSCVPKLKLPLPRVSRVLWSRLMPSRHDLCGQTRLGGQHGVLVLFHGDVESHAGSSGQETRQTRCQQVNRAQPANPIRHSFSATSFLTFDDTNSHRLAAGGFCSPGVEGRSWTRFPSDGR